MLIANPSQSPPNEPLPDTAVPNDLQYYSSNKNFWLVTEFSLMKDNPRDYTIPCTVELFLSTQQNSDCLLNEIQWYHPSNDAIPMMKESTIIVASDGPSKIDASTFSCIISTTMGNWTVSNTGICAGEDNYSYRSEIMAILLLVSTYQIFFNMIQQ